MAWVESHQSLARHPKLYAFQDRLGLKRTEAIGALHLVWWWAIDYAPTGEIPKAKAGLIAKEAEYTGEPEAFVQAMLDAGFLDEIEGVFVLHDWEDYRLFADASKDRIERRRKKIRRRVQRFRDKTRNAVSNAPVTPMKRDVTRTNNLTKPNLTKPIKDSESGVPVEAVDNGAAHEPTTTQEAGSEYLFCSCGHRRESHGGGSRMGFRPEHPDGCFLCDCPTYVFARTETPTRRAPLPGSKVEGPGQA